MGRDIFSQPINGNSETDRVGHRSRLRARFLATSGEGMPDYELLELLLMLAVPRRDVKPLAKQLIARFGDFAGVVSADIERLSQVKGAISAIKLAQVSANRLLREQVIGRDVITSWQNLIDYCRAAMAHEKVEQLRLLFLDRKNVLIADEVQQRGTVDHAPLYVREVVKRALELGASAVILVHNYLKAISPLPAILGTRPKNSALYFTIMW
jgi:DNA repair protein RadC